MYVAEQSRLHEKRAEVNMPCLFEYLLRDIVKGHYVHRTLISKIGPVLSVAHADSSARGRISFHQVAGVNALGLERSAHQGAERVASYQAHKANFAAQGGGIGREYCGRTAQCNRHFTRKLLLADLGLGFNSIENNVNVKLAYRGNVILLHCYQLLALQI